MHRKLGIFQAEERSIGDRAQLALAAPRRACGISAGGAATAQARACCDRCAVVA